ncbi:DUF4351 domain-containing protein [Nostoc sp.]|uniref:DUF4351 domain-containing protein n=1 Tax=Nostoc sp. TaxID=1180 RepID=UPI002FF6D9A3
MSYDNACKYLAEQYPTDFVRWLLGIEVQQIEVLKTELTSTLFLANPALLPLASLTRTNSPQTLLAQVAEQVATILDREERQNIAGCVEILAGLRFDKDLVRQFLREDVMKESVIYQDIVQKEAFKLISRQLRRRFGDIDESLIEQVRNLSAEQLENLGEDLLDFSKVADLVAWVEQQKEEK